MDMCKIQDHSRAPIKTFSTLGIKRFVAAGALWMLIATVLVPHVEIEGIGIGLDDLYAAFLLMVFIGYLALKPNNFLFRKDGFLVTVLWASIIFTGIVFSVIGGLYNIDQFRLPTEMWQYVKRMLFFYCACYVSYMSLVSPRNFYRCIQCILLVALLIGILQILPGNLGDYLASLYARTERQLLGMEKSFAQLRNYGIAGHSIAWGGFAVFGVAVSLGGLLAPRGGRVKRRFYRFQLWFILILAIINVLFSGSRVAITALLVVYLVFVLLGFICARRKLCFFTTYIAGVGLISIGFIYALWDKILFIIFRLETLVDASGGNRVQQIKAALSLLADVQSWTFGVGNATQRALATSFGTEVEPVYLLVNYGIVGVTLRYGLLLIIFIYAWRQLKRAETDDWNLAAATIIALAGYVIFSLGYFFYQELYVGILPWLLFGWIVGAYYREKHLRLAGAAGSNLTLRELER